MRVGRFLLSEISRKHIGINSRNLEKMIEEMDTFSDSETEEVANILYGMSKGNNWEY